MPYNRASSAINFSIFTIQIAAPLDKIDTFLREEVALTLTEVALPTDTFLLGVTLRGTTILFDRKRLKNCGDLLHEAGHLAMLASAARARYEHSSDTLPMGFFAWIVPVWRNFKVLE